jgi:hypothetical protein
LDVVFTAAFTKSKIFLLTIFGKVSWGRMEIEKLVTSALTPALSPRRGRIVSSLFREPDAGLVEWIFKKLRA